MQIPSTYTVPFEGLADLIAQTNASQCPEQGSSAFLDLLQWAQACLEESTGSLTGTADMPDVGSLMNILGDEPDDGDADDGRLDEALLALALSLTGLPADNGLYTTDESVEDSVLTGEGRQSDAVQAVLRAVAERIGGFDIPDSREAVCADGAPAPETVGTADGQTAQTADNRETAPAVVNSLGSGQPAAADAPAAKIPAQSSADDTEAGTARSAFPRLGELRDERAAQTGVPVRDVREPPNPAAAKSAAQSLTQASDAQQSVIGVRQDAEPSDGTAYGSGSGEQSLKQNSDPSSRENRDSLTDRTAGRETVSMGLGSSAVTGTHPSAASFVEELGKAQQDPVVRQIIDKADFSALNRGGTLEIVLEPDSLGGVTIQLESTAEGVAVSILADNSKVREVLEGQLGQLTASLRQSGIQPDTVRVVSAPSSADAQNSASLPDFGSRAGQQQTRQQLRVLSREPLQADSPVLDIPVTARDSRINLYG